VTHRDKVLSGDERKAIAATPRNRAFQQFLFVTTNLPFERWTEVLGNEGLVAVTLDRLTHRCHLLEATGESYRLKEARRRRQASEKGGAREER